MSAQAVMTQDAQPTQTAAGRVLGAVERYFTEGLAGTPHLIANLYTTKEGVQDMRKAFEEAGLPREAVRWNKADGCHKLTLAAADTQSLTKVAALMGRYGDGSEGHQAWQGERQEQMALGNVVKNVGRAAVQPAVSNDAGPQARTNLFTTKEGVGAMRKGFEEAGVPREALRWNKEGMHHVLALPANATVDRAKLGGLVQEYGEGSAGHQNWLNERGSAPKEQGPQPQAGGQPSRPTAASRPRDENTVLDVAPDILMYVPYSDRERFDDRVVEKGGTYRYDASVDNGFGGRGAFILTGGDPADFADWTKPEAHAQFVAEHNEREDGDQALRNAARQVAAERSNDPFARFYARGVMMPRDEAAGRLVVAGGKDSHGRELVGLDKASPDKLKDLASRTSQSIAYLSRKEDKIRFGFAVRNDETWRGKYQRASRADEPTQAVAKLFKDFGMLDFNKKRDLATYRASDGSLQTAGLKREETGEMASLRRGYQFLAARYKEVTGHDIGVSVSGLRKAVENEQAAAQVDTKSEVIAGDAKKAASSFRRRQQSGHER
ncbi:hypothetical protein [Microvirga tunisiensis]|uniref:Uncharacterized protein n=1 Tax=Microvirga tunisiensis TaxID=2108360 RepID=A0A5N7MAC9_9HYPH|nr:hypothetical protein [Microvirga tunisiensis]MPR05681.1 hypothetical protein [Microvirga tunisiensis]MPR23881.1 hypothetical protein [Microvirga tunisiensis]